MTRCTISENFSLIFLLILRHDFGKAPAYLHAEDLPSSVRDDILHRALHRVDAVFVEVYR